MKPASITPVHCWRCDALTFYALLPTAPRSEVVLDAEPVEAGPLWVDAYGVAREVRELYRDGEPRYTPHLLTCRARQPFVADDAADPAESEVERYWRERERGTGGGGA